MPPAQVHPGDGGDRAGGDGVADHGFATDHMDGDRIHVILQGADREHEEETRKYWRIRAGGIPVHGTSCRPDSDSSAAANWDE